MQAAAPQTALDSSAEPARKVRSRVILVVEDERIVARDLQMRLTKLGYNVPAIASSKAEALHLLECILPELVVMDIRLNGVPEGIDAAREIRQRYDLPVIYLTAHSDTDTLEQAKFTEPFGYILKPFEDRELLASIETAVHKHQIERRLRETERRLRHQSHLVSLSHDAIITADPSRLITSWNAGAQEIYGWTETEAVGRLLHELLSTVSPVSIAQMDEALQCGGRWDGELTHTARDGNQVFVESRQVLVRAENGQPLGILEINRDISDRKHAQSALERTLEELRGALAEKTVLLQEVHHRVKNNLAVICSLLSMKADATGNYEVQSALMESQQRVRSIALIHEQLYGTDHLDRIRFADYAKQLATELESAFGAASRGISIAVQAESVELEVYRAVPCALILNELVTNSLKHAFPDGRQGKLAISFRQSLAGFYELTVEDDGAGMHAASGEPAVKSTGMRILHILTRQLEGTLEQEYSRGTRFVLRFPVAD